MGFAQQLREALAPYHLLGHPFYQKWTQGQLDRDILKHYASEYYHHVKAFPRYISATHSLCEDIQQRQVLLENLNDEENGSEHHPELWLRFAEGLKCERQSVESRDIDEATKGLIETFFQTARSSYEEGLCALYAYEYQVPEVAETKIDGLKKFYGVEDDRTLQFFSVHQGADVVHRQACEELIDQIPEEKRPAALQAATKVSKALWDFLSRVDEKHQAA